MNKHYKNENNSLGNLSSKSDNTEISNKGKKELPIKEEKEEPLIKEEIILQDEEFIKEEVTVSENEGHIEYEKVTEESIGNVMESFLSLKQDSPPSPDFTEKEQNDLAFIEVTKNKNSTQTESIETRCSKTKYMKECPVCKRQVVRLKRHLLMTHKFTPSEVQDIIYQMRKRRKDNGRGRKCPLRGCDNSATYSRLDKHLDQCHTMQRRRCGAAHGDITHKPMKGVTLVRRCRFRRTVPQHAAAAPDRRNAASGRVMGKHTHSSMPVVITPDIYATSRASLMFDVDLFIQCVHARPTLWEKSDKEYCDKNSREKAWIEIGEIMYDNWPHMESAERNEKVKEMKGKWRNVRDRFVKHINQDKSGDSAVKKKKYVFADALSFLLQTIEKRKTWGNIVEDTDEEENKEKERSEGGDSDEGLATSVCEKRQRTEYRQRVSADLTPFQNVLLKKMVESSKQQEEDPDKAYLISLLPEYKQLNDDEKLNFRLLNIQFFQSIRRHKSQNLQPDHLPHSLFLSSQ